MNITSYCNYGFSKILANLLWNFQMDFNIKQSVKMPLSIIWKTKRLLKNYLIILDIIIKRKTFFVKLLDAIRYYNIKKHIFD